MCINDKAMVICMPRRYGLLPVARQDAGFTLMEVVIALAIAAGVLVAVLGSLSYHMRVSLEMGELVTASVIGREMIEDSLATGLPLERSGVFEGEHGRFAWRLDTSDAGIEDLKRIELSVLWPGAGAEAGGGIDGTESLRSVSFVSYRRTQ